MTIPMVRIAPPLFGEPVLSYQNAGMAGWCKENSVSQWQKGSGWTANLYGGTQTAWDDWAAIFIPVNELHLTDFNSAMWSYYMTETETFGVNIVLWVHDPNDFDKRAEITQLGSVVEKATGWDAHELNRDTVQFFFLGENTGDTSLSSGSDNLHSLNTFKSDSLFRGWTIYRTSFEYGWETGGDEFKDVWVADIKLNGERILLVPQSGERAGGESKYLYKGTTGNSTTRVTLVTPAVAKRIRIHSIYMVTASATGSTFELYFDTGTYITSDASKAIALVQLDTDKVSSESIQFGSDGPLGVIGDVVSMRTGTDITTYGSYVITYHEE